MVSNTIYNPIGFNHGVLHISDLHFGYPGNTAQWDQKIVLSRLASDLQQDRKSYSMIVVTGDIAYHGRPEEYQLAKSWLDKLAEGLHVPNDLVFTVPGNHDVDLSVCEDGKNKAYLDSIRSGSTHHVDEERQGDELDEITQKRFAGYLDFARSYAKECVNPYGWKVILVPHEGGIRRALDSDDLTKLSSINLVGLNTALVSQRNDLKSLRLGLQTAGELDLFEPPPESLNVVLTHHPIGNGGEQWLTDDEEDLFATAVARSNLYMCGHVHQPSARSITDAQETTIRLVAGALYDPPHDGGSLPLPSSHSYCRVSIESVKSQQWKVSVWPERWSKARREFQPDHDVVGRRESSRSFFLPPESRNDFGSVRSSLVGGHDGNLAFKPWLRYVPKRIFGAAEVGFNSEFVAHFNRHMMNSWYYYYRGGSGRVTTVQLARLLESEHSLLKVRLLFCAPEERSVDRRLRIERPGAPLDPNQVVAEIDELLCSICGLDAMARANSGRFPDTEISFYREDVHYRMELTQRAAYMTYLGYSGAHGAIVYYPADPERERIEQSENGRAFSMYETNLNAFESSFAFAREESRIRVDPDEGVVWNANGGSEHPPTGLAEFVAAHSEKPVSHFTDMWTQRLDDVPFELLGIG